MEEKEGIIPTALSLVLFIITAGFELDGMTITVANMGGTGYFTAIIMAILGG